MADRDDVGREQITALGRRVDAIAHEIDREHGIRWRLHSAENLLTAHGLIIKLACAVSGAIGTVLGAVVTTLIRG